MDFVQPEKLSWMFQNLRDTWLEQSYLTLIKNYNATALNSNYDQIRRFLRVLRYDVISYPHKQRFLREQVLGIT